MRIQFDKSLSSRSKIIYKEIIKIVEQFKLHPYDINNGECDNFADDVYSSLKSLNINVEIKDSTESKYNNHFWIYDPIDKKHYDAEEPYGVIKWRHLPIFLRFNAK